MREIMNNLPILMMAVMAAFVSELAGVLNIAIEGIMLLGSFLAVVSLQGAFGNIPGVILAAGFGLLAGLLLGLFHGRFGANIFVAGLGLNLIAVSLCTIGGQIFFNTKGTIPLSTQLGTDAIWLIQAGLALAVYLFILITFSWSLMGLRFRSLANHSEMLYARGVNTSGYRLWALGVSGALAALAGAFTTFSLDAYVPNGTMGKGWIAMVLVFAGGKHPVGILLATLVYLGLDHLAVGLQAEMSQPGLAVGLPYLGVLGILVLVQLLTRRRFEL